MHSRLVDFDGHRLVITGDGQRFRIVAEQELGLEPRGRKPTPAEITTTAKFAFMTAAQKRLLAAGLDPYGPLSDRRKVHRRGC